MKKPFGILLSLALAACVRAEPVGEVSTAFILIGANHKVVVEASHLLDPYERLVKIEIMGKAVEVPEKNRLLRCFQYLSLNTISYGDFCWNGDCTNCQVWYHTTGQSKADDRTGLSCRMEVIEGMVITSMSPFIKLEGITK